MIKRLLFIALLVSTGQLLADNQLGAELGDWVDDKAVPKLSELLTRHPRFKGMPIKVMAMKDGYPDTISDELTHQIKSQLIDGLLKTSDIRIAIESTAPCQPLKVDTILGIEVKKQHGNKYRVALAMIDIEEGIWLNGSNISWQGKVSRDQKKAYEMPFTSPAAGLAVLNLNQTAAITEALVSQLQCSVYLPSPLYFEPVEDESIAAIQSRIKSRLSRSFATTIQLSEAASIINLQHIRKTGSNDARIPTHLNKDYFTHTLGLNMATTSAPEDMHRIATVRVVQEPTMANPVARTTINSTRTSGDHSEVAPDLLTEIKLVSNYMRSNACQTGDRQCVDIRFSLKRPAYTVIFYSKNGELRPITCDKPTRNAAGSHHYGLILPEGTSPDIPATGFYVVAVEKRSTAIALNQTLTNTSHHCTGEGADDPQALITFRDSLKKFSRQTDWQAIHLTRIDNQIVKL